MTFAKGNSTYFERYPYDIEILRKVSFLKRNEKWVKVATLGIAAGLIFTIITLAILHQECQDFILKLEAKNKIEFLETNIFLSSLITDLLLTTFTLLGFLTYVHYQKYLQYKIWKFAIVMLSIFEGIMYTIFLSNSILQENVFIFGIVILDFIHLIRFWLFMTYLEHHNSPKSEE